MLSLRALRVPCERTSRAGGGGGRGLSQRSPRSQRREGRGGGRGSVPGSSRKWSRTPTRPRNTDTDRGSRTGTGTAAAAGTDGSSGGESLSQGSQRTPREESLGRPAPPSRRCLRSRCETSFSPGPGRIRWTEPRSPGGDLVPPRGTPAPTRAPVRTRSQVPAATCHPDRASAASERRDLPRLRRAFGCPECRPRSGDPSTSRGSAPLRSG